MRHIPAGPSRELALLSFAEALRPSAQSEPFDREAWIYIPDHYADYRYVLGTVGERPLIAMGINPSTAAPGRLDRTLQSVERIARANGYDSFLMFNVYAQRATAPEDMDRERNESLHRENLLAFRWLLDRSGEAPAVWAAWGNIIELRPYLRDCLSDFLREGSERGARWYHAGPVSKKGHPHHPLYLKGDTPLAPFDIKSYLYSRS